MPNPNPPARCPTCGGKRDKPRKVNDLTADVGTPPPGGALVEPIPRRRCRNAFHNPPHPDPVPRRDVEHE